MSLDLKRVREDALDAGQSASKKRMTLTHAGHKPEPNGAGSGPAAAADEEEPVEEWMKVVEVGSGPCIVQRKAPWDRSRESCWTR